MSNIKKENNVSKKEEKTIKTEEKVDKKNIDYKAIIIWAIFIIVFIFFIGFLYKNFFTSSFSNSDVESIINEKKTQVIYIENSNASKCKNCSKIKKYLDDKKINYKTYDVNKVSESEYNKLLKTLNIDKDVFGCPAVIYIKSGVMFSNIINIDSTTVVDQFIKDYNLK